MNWDVPKNWPELLDGLDWVLLDGRWVPMDTPSTVVPQVSRRRDGDGLFLHLLNYDSSKTIDSLSIKLSSSLIEPTAAMWRTPEDPKPCQLKLTKSVHGVELQLPAWDCHGTIILK